VRLAAFADAVALLGGAQHALVGAEVEDGRYSGVGWSGPCRSEVSIGGVSMILPGLNIPAGSKVAFTRRIRA
jgi:hypothetical protein